MNVWLWKVGSEQTFSRYRQKILSTMTECAACIYLVAINKTKNFAVLSIHLWNGNARPAITNDWSRVFSRKLAARATPPALEKLLLMSNEYGPLPHALAFRFLNGISARVKLRLQNTEWISNKLHYHENLWIMDRRQLKEEPRPEWLNFPSHGTLTVVNRVWKLNQLIKNAVNFPSCNWMQQLHKNSCDLGSAKEKNICLVLRKP